MESIELHLENILSCGLTLPRNVDGDGVTSNLNVGGLFARISNQSKPEELPKAFLFHSWHGL